LAATAQLGVRSLSQMSTRTKFMVMAGTLLGLFTSAMDQTVVGTSMPRIVADLGGFGLFSWVGTGFMLASTTTVPIVGKLTDMFGRKPFYMAGIFILILGSALAGSSQSIEQLIAFRVVQGLGAGMIMGIAFAIIGDVFPPAERGKWSGLMAGVFALASVLGPLIGGALTDHAHWRWVFYVNLPLGAVALSVLFFGMPYIRPASRPKLDYRGILLLMATVVPMRWLVRHSLLHTAVRPGRHRPVSHKLRFRDDAHDDSDGGLRRYSRPDHVPHRTLPCP
jgi:multidrug resistance protein